MYGKPLDRKICTADEEHKTEEAVGFGERKCTNYNNFDLSEVNLISVL
jgi:hypothetical protein